MNSRSLNPALCSIFTQVAHPIHERIPEKWQICLVVATGCRNQVMWMELCKYLEDSGLSSRGKTKKKNMQKSQKARMKALIYLVNELSASLVIHLDFLSIKLLLDV